MKFLRLNYFDSIKHSKTAKQVSFVSRNIRKPIPVNYDRQAELWYLFFWYCVPSAVYDNLRKLFVEGDEPELVK